MLKNLLIITSIVLAATLAINNTIDKYNEKISTSILTPSQNQMRQPNKHNPGQNLYDSQTQRKRNSKTDRSWNNNPNNQVNKNDNFNRNKERVVNPLQKN